MVNEPNAPSATQEVTGLESFVKGAQWARENGYEASLGGFMFLRRHMLARLGAPNGLQRIFVEETTTACYKCKRPIVVRIDSTGRKDVVAGD